MCLQYLRQCCFVCTACLPCTTKSGLRDTKASLVITAIFKDVLDGDHVGMVRSKRLLLDRQGPFQQRPPRLDVSLNSRWSTLSIGC